MPGSCAAGERSVDPVPRPGSRMATAWGKVPVPRALRRRDLADAVEESVPNCHQLAQGRAGRRLGKGR